ncbi:hypothetical protein V8G54_027415 [Vigna mungo]|uniref:Cytochrome c oxidase assembly factor 5 n=1 Tax=Vigna mungo TaxID=3915 RepID=A0AAQ3N297_VIGMU
MSKSCKGLAAELVKCLSESDCIKVEKRSYRECVGEKSPCIPNECVGLRETYFNCKRGQASLFLLCHTDLFKLEAMTCSSQKFEIIVEYFMIGCCQGVKLQSWFRIRYYPWCR